MANNNITTPQCQCSLSRPLLTTQLIFGMFTLFFFLLLYIPGKSSECPTPGNLADDTECVDKGRCQKGECKPFCEALHNLESCACNGKCLNKPSSVFTLVPNRDICFNDQCWYLVSSDEQNNVVSIYGRLRLVVTIFITWVDIFQFPYWHRP